jgi:hypothetical protein
LTCTSWSQRDDSRRTYHELRQLCCLYVSVVRRPVWWMMRGMRRRLVLTPV